MFFNVKHIKRQSHNYTIFFISQAYLCINFAQILYHTFSKMLIEIIININAEIKKKLWNNFILNRLNVKCIL